LRTSRTRAAGTSQPLQLLGEVEVEVGAADHRVDPLGAHQVLGTENGGCVGGERGPEGADVLGRQLQPGSRAVPAKAGQVLPAGLERGE
jgi:hypothetical protein